jgi:hypothetical protein
MPGEDGEAVQNKINLYIIEQGAETQAEKDCIEVAVKNFFKFKRCDDADTAAEDRVVNDVANNFVDRQCLRCAQVVPNLASAPAATIIELRSFSHGICWALSQVELLEEHLQRHTTFEPHQRLLFIRLCGRNPRDMFTDPIVKQSNLDYLSGLHGAGNITVAQAAELFAEDRPAEMPLNEFDWILAKWLKELVSVKEGQALLRQSVAELEQRLAKVDEREAIDLALAVREAKVSVNDGCMKRLRYRRESERGQQAAMRLFHQLQMMRLKYGDRLGIGAPAAPAQAEPADPKGGESPSTPPAESGQRTEAAAPEVAGGISSNDEASPAAGRPASGDYNWTPEQIAEVVANQQRKRESERQRE